jgi:isocitrate dehydrogenase
LQDHFAPLAKALADNKQKILEEFRAVQGKPVDIGGYFMPDRKQVTDVMRPRATFNALLAGKSCV